MKLLFPLLLAGSSLFAQISDEIGAITNPIYKDSLDLTKEAIYRPTESFKPMKEIVSPDTLKSQNYVFFMSNSGIPSLTNIPFWDNYFKMQSWADHLYKLTPNKTSKRNFLRMISQLKQEMKPQDNLLVYVHGYTWGKYDTHYTFQLKSIKLTDLEEKVKSIPARKSLVLYSFGDEPIGDSRLTEYFK